MPIADRHGQLVDSTRPVEGIPAGVVIRQRLAGVQPTAIVDQLVAGPLPEVSGPRDTRRVAGRPVIVDLFDGEQARFEPVEVTVSSPDGLVPGFDPMHGGVRPVTVSWIGRRLNNDGSDSTAQFTLIPRTDGTAGFDVAARVLAEQRTYQLAPQPDGTHVLSELDMHSYPDLPEGRAGVAVSTPVTETSLSDPVEAVVPVDGATAPSTALPAEPSGTDTSTTGVQSLQTVNYVIDVMIAYTGVTATALVQQVDFINWAFVNSNMNQRARLVRLEPVTYTFPADNDDALNNLRIPNDGVLDQLHPLRTQVGADLVSLAGSTCSGGVGYVPPSSGDATLGFAVTCTDVFAEYGFAHEFGHNFGGHHDPYTLFNTPGSPAPAPYNYSEAHLVSNSTRQALTIMGYHTGCDQPGYSGCPKLPQYSNPNRDFIGLPGTPSGITNVRDNARSLTNLAAPVAAYRNAWPEPGSMTSGSTRMPAVPTIPGAQASVSLRSTPCPIPSRPSIAP